MRPIFIGSPLSDDDKAFKEWALEAFRLIEEASNEDIAAVADGYTITGTLTETRDIDVSTPTAANVASVLATLIADIKRRGQKRRDA